MAKKIKKKILKYTADFIPEKEGGFTVEVPALPGCVTCGDTFEQAKRMVKEAIGLYCGTLRERNLPLPEDEDYDFLKMQIEVPLKVFPQYASK